MNKGLIEQHLAEAIESLDTSEFETALSDWFQLCVPHDNIAILAYDQEGASLIMYRSDNPKVHQNLAGSYLNGLYLLDPFHELYTGNAPSGVYRLSDIAPDKFHLNQYFTEYYRSTTMIDEIAFVCYPSASVSLHICLGRDSISNRRFSSKLLAIAQDIAPIVTALAERHWRSLNTSGEYAEAVTTANLVQAIKDKHGTALTPRQAEVAMLILRGHSTASIGLKLGISPQTVKVFRKQLYKKCQISSQAELFNLVIPLLGPKSMPIPTI